MPTITAGTTAQVVCPLASTITINPGSAGRVSVGGRNNLTGASVVHREIYTATTFDVVAGDVLSVEAINTDATYTTPAGADTSLQALVSGAGYPLTPRLIGGGVDIAGSRTITNAGPIVLGSVLIPGGSIGAVGMLRIRGRWVSSSNVTNKTFTVTLGGVTLMTSGPGLAGNIIWPFDYIIINRGSESSQSWHPSAAGSMASANTAIGTSTVNTAIDQTLEIRGTVVTESLTLEYFSVEVQRFA